MSISSSLSAGVAGLNANARRLATISDNIANSSTFGYKRAVTDFHSLVVNGDLDTAYTAGGVRTTSRRVVQERGQIVTTNNSTDLAISGRGMLPVIPEASIDQPGPPDLSLITTGSFSPNDAGVLQTSSGYVLMGWPAGADGEIPAFSRDTSTGLEPVQVREAQFYAEPTTSIQMALNLPAGETEAGAAGTPQELAVEYFGTLGESESLVMSFTPDVPAAGSSNTWTLSISDGASGGAVVAEYQLEFDTTAGSGGMLLNVNTITGTPYDAATGTLPIAVANGDIDIDIGQIGATGGLTQLDAGFAPFDLTKNGTPVVNLLGVEVDANGILSGVYESGISRVLYQIPLADVPNPDALIAGDAQTFRISNESGPMFLWDAGDGPTGDMLSYALEGSTTDVAVELTQLIQTQRAYSSNAKVIQTVDEMLQETTNIKR